VLFDEPLTVIDPHLKWQLRRKLKQIHHELKLTLIYVTHDQIEALTFADQVVVMSRGRAVQVGSASELFERPRHTFVGHFIGSPGMNFLPARWDAAHGGVDVDGRQLGAVHAPPALAGTADFKLGVRPEYVELVAADTPGAAQASVLKHQDIGTYQLLTAQVGKQLVRARLTSETRAPVVGDEVWLQLIGPHTCYYVNEELIT
jgi:glycerol transport system ATP-binding protein